MHPGRRVRLSPACLLALVAACSTTQGVGGPSPVEAGASGDAGSLDAGGHVDSAVPSDAGVPGSDGSGVADAADAGADAAPPLLLPSCLGASAPMILSGTSAYIAVAVGATFAADAGLTAGEPFLVDFGSTYSSIDLSAFSPAPATENCNPMELGQDCTFSNLSFFGDRGPVVLETESFSGGAGGVTQAGILGTDFLSAQPITLDYQGAEILGGSKTAFCTDAELTAAGFAPMTTAGFYSNVLASLSPLTTVDSAGMANYTVPDVPTVKVSVGGVSALAQLDTGFDDDVDHHSVNINQAYLATLMAQNPGAIVRDASLDLTLTTCVDGTSETVEAYRLAAGTSFEFVADSGTAARSVSDAILFAKNTPKAALVCGGIGTWTVPAAQVAQSFYVDAGAVVFDPIGAKVWMPQQ